MLSITAHWIDQYCNNGTRIKDTKFIVHGFADDHQLYRSFVKEQEYQILVQELPSCFAEIENWMASLYLQLNADKQR